MSAQAITPESRPSPRTGFSRTSTGLRTPGTAARSASSVPGAGASSISTIDSRPASREPRGAGPRSCAIVPITPTATVVTNSASITPLTARNPADGLSASRRAAISAAGRPARAAIARAPTMVSHGPPVISPTMTSSRAGRNSAV